MRVCEGAQLLRRTIYLLSRAVQQAERLKRRSDSAKVVSLRNGSLCSVKCLERSKLESLSSQLLIALGEFLAARSLDDGQLGIVRRLDGAKLTGVRSLELGQLLCVRGLESCRIVQLRFEARKLGDLLRVRGLKLAKLGSLRLVGFLERCKLGLLRLIGGLESGDLGGLKQTLSVAARVTLLDQSGYLADLVGLGEGCKTEEKKRIEVSGCGRKSDVSVLTLLHRWPSLPCWA